MNRRQRRELQKKRKWHNTTNELANKTGVASWYGMGKHDLPKTEAVVYVPGVNCPPTLSDEFKSKVDNNIWHDRDQLQKFVDTILKLSIEDDFDWSWAYNSACKYLNLRIDMRDGGFILTNQDGHRIDLPQLEWQYKSVKE